MWALAIFWSIGVSAQDAVPPRIVELPAIELAPGTESPGGGELLIEALVAVDGTATVARCEAAEALCATAAAALSRARIEPARRAGVAVAARVLLRFQVVASEAPAPTPAPPPPPDVAPVPGFSATARVQRPVIPGARRLELAEMRDLPGAFGDPFRAIDTLPGVVPVLSGLPYVYVRGAPPSGTLYVYDDIPLPTLFHLALGPAVVHPRMVGPVRLYSAVAPARYGRLVGGAVVGEGPRDVVDPAHAHGELELRLLDVNGYVEAPFANGHVAAAGRVGYPGLLLEVFSPEVELQYWDYQLRGTLELSRRDRIEIVALGAYDYFRQTADESSRISIHFHRLEGRFVRRQGTLTLGSALQLGWERSALAGTGGLEVTALRAGPRIWLERRLSDLRWRVGADAVWVAGSLTRPTFGTGTLEPIIDIDIDAHAAARAIAGAYCELDLRLSPALDLQLGGRADIWYAGGVAETAVDPRLRATWHPGAGVDVHAAAGVVRQPAVFVLPLPGLADVAIGRGLQTSVQLESGVSIDLPWALRAEVQAFFHRYDEVIFLDALFLDDTVCTRELCEELDIDPRTDGTTYGAEVFLRREHGRVRGFLSYTLAWSEVDPVLGQTFVPNTDTRHVANLVLQLRLGSGFTAGVRAFARSGKPVGEWRLDLAEPEPLSRLETRLPPFFRLDVQVAYGWRTSFGRMRISLEWFNVTLAREALGLECSSVAPDAPPDQCPVEYAPAIFFPNLGVRGEF